MILMPLPPSMNTLAKSKPPTWASTTSAAFPGKGTLGGCSAREKVMLASNHRRYSGVAGGEVSAMFTCLVVNFWLLLDGAAFCIMHTLPFDCGYCSSSANSTRCCWWIPAAWCALGFCTGGAGSCRGGGGGASSAVPLVLQGTLRVVLLVAASMLLLRVVEISCRL